MLTITMLTPPVVMIDNISLIYQDPQTGDTWTLQNASLEKDFPTIVNLIFGEDQPGLLPDIHSLHQMYTSLQEAGEVNLLLLLKNNLPITLIDLQHSQFANGFTPNASSRMLQLFYLPENSPLYNPQPYAETIALLLRHFHTLYLAIEIYDDEMISLANQLGLSHFLTTEIFFIPKTIYQISRNNPSSAI